jgi:hypothetical protein
MAGKFFMGRATPSFVILPAGRRRREAGGYVQGLNEKSRRVSTRREGAHLLTVLGPQFCQVFASAVDLETDLLGGSLNRSRQFRLP